MSEKPFPSHHLIRLKRAFWLDEGPPAEPGGLRLFLNRYLWLFLVMAVLIGVSSGLIAEFHVFKRNEHPAVSLGLFVIPPVLLGWLTLRPGKGALVGLIVLLAATLGHFLGAQFTEYEQNNLEYRGWIFIAASAGTLLGLLGQKIRSPRMVVRALAASTPATLLCLPLYAWHADVAYFSDHIETHWLAFDVAGALLVLLLCRGIVARMTAILCAPALAYPLGLALILTSPITWFAGGGR